MLPILFPPILVAQRNTRLPDSVRIATWTVLGTYIAFSIAGYFYVIFYFMMKDPALIADQSRQFSALASLQLAEHPFLATITATYVAYSLCKRIIVSTDQTTLSRIHDFGGVKRKNL